MTNRTKIPGEEAILTAVSEAMAGVGPYTKQTSTESVLDAVRGSMEQQGYPADIDPVLVAVAVLPPKAVNSVSSADILRPFAPGFQESKKRMAKIHLANPGSSPDTKAAAQAVLDKDDLPEVPFDPRLDNKKADLLRFGRRAAVAGMVGGLLIGSYSYATVSNTKAHLGHEITASPFGYDLAIKYDRSILPGDKGAGIPVIGPILARVPGIPDFSDIHYQREEVVAEQVPVKRTMRVNTGGNANNPTVNDLKLTGEEYGLDLEAAERLVGQLEKAKIKVTGLEVTGIASDVYNGRLGQENPEQEPLERARAKTMERALRDVAKGHGFELPEEAKIVIEEDVMSTKEQKIVDDIAIEFGMSTELLMQKYVDGKLPEAITKQIDKLSQPGARVTIHGTQLHQKTVTRTVERSNEDVIPDSVSGEFVGGFMGLVGAGIGHGYGMIGMLLMADRTARRRARREVKRALKDAGMK